MPEAIRVPGAPPVPLQTLPCRPKLGPEEPLYTYTIGFENDAVLLQSEHFYNSLRRVWALISPIKTSSRKMARMPGSYAPPSGELLIAVGTIMRRRRKIMKPRPKMTTRRMLCWAASHSANSHVHMHKDMNSGCEKVPLQAQANRAASRSHTHPDPVSSNADDDGKAPANIDTKPGSKYCELKRLYVTPAARGLGVGKALVNAMLAVARQIGYEEVRLDTLPDMREAIAMYRGMGFGVVEKYYETAIEGTVFLGLRL
ncbi:acetyltransferase [Blastomyces gilchristii SLH14081]|uniref:Acetyltransferase n=1 Tax=Blastomyces gilchristii (strain SLH14081) TaxID=559298 RepID=A0A179V182_BLAGS|nr:acetyltransferase [Blastomyces gilchristii SLH14081]OAT13840.1 acetyltransferase [Blastomyces gilchristii SLH14081]